MELDQIVAGVDALERVVGTTPSSEDQAIVGALHALYRRAFLGFAWKGVAEGEANDGAEPAQRRQGDALSPDAGGPTGSPPAEANRA